MKIKKVIIITSTGDISDIVREYFSKRYADTKLVIVSTNPEGGIDFFKLREKHGKVEIITLQGVLAQWQIEIIKKGNETITEWTLDSVTGRPMYPFTHRKH